LDNVRVQLITQHIHQLELNRAEVIRSSSDPVAEQVRQLLRLKDIGMNSAWLYVMEFFSWRGFHNRREVGSLAGLTPTPYQSGDCAREQGISKAGNRQVRAMAIEITWAWLRFQPDSRLSSWWYQERFGKGCKLGVGSCFCRKFVKKVGRWRTVVTPLYVWHATRNTCSRSVLREFLRGL
jgi:transposase